MVVVVVKRVAVCFFINMAVGVCGRGWKGVGIIHEISPSRYQKLEVHRNVIVPPSARVLLGHACAYFLVGMAKSERRKRRPLRSLCISKHLPAHCSHVTLSSHPRTPPTTQYSSSEAWQQHHLQMPGVDATR